MINAIMIASPNEILNWIFAAIIIAFGIWIFIEEVVFIIKHRHHLCIMPWWWVKAMYGVSGLWMSIVYLLIIHASSENPLTTLFGYELADSTHSILIRPGIIILLSSVLAGAIITRKTRN